MKLQLFASIALVLLNAVPGVAVSRNRDFNDN